MATTILTETAAGAKPKSPLDRFLEALRAHAVDYSRQDAHNATYACPVHRDKDMAASARMTESGRLLLRCHACDAGFLETLKAVGLSVYDVRSVMAGAGGPVAVDAYRRDELASDAHVEWMCDLAVEYELAIDRRPDMLAELATRLGVSEASLRDIGVGYRDGRNPYLAPDGQWVDRGPCWTFPERDGRLAIVGIGTRYVDPAYGKAAVKGSRRGLIVPISFEYTTAGPIYVVEGPSDVAAMLTADCCAIGRPGAAGGARDLARLFALFEIDPGRPLVVIGENDKKPDGSWPGREGAMRVAALMQRDLGRDIRVIFPPAGIKDAHEWRKARSAQQARRDSRGSE